MALGVGTVARMNYRRDCRYYFYGYPCCGKNKKG